MTDWLKKAGQFVSDGVRSLAAELPGASGPSTESSLVAFDERRTRFSKVESDHAREQEMQQERARLEEERDRLVRERQRLEQEQQQNRRN